MQHLLSHTTRHSHSPFPVSTCPDILTNLSLSFYFSLVCAVWLFFPNMSCSILSLVLTTEIVKGKDGLIKQQRLV